MIVEIKSKDRVPGSFKKIEQVAVRIDFVEGIEFLLNKAMELAEKELDAPVGVVGFSKNLCGIDIYFRRSSEIFDSRSI